ncbi:MAG: ABC transporter ATP-binding protein [Negativicutes bacterium]
MRILEVRNLKKYYVQKTGWFGQNSRITKAVDGVDFHVDSGETLGLVGESGCGKSTAGRLILSLEIPTEGNILLEGKNLQQLDLNEKQEYRKKVQMIFQDSFASLDPRMTVEEIIGEALDIHKIPRNASERRDMITKILYDVGLDSEQMKRYPHEFSGGQRQRIGIARAICLQPKLIVCDEPVSALDISIQAQIINMLNEIKRKYALSYVFISHDLSVIKHVSDRVMVMYLGKIMEMTDKKELFANPAHPYTQALISAIPIVSPGMKRDRIILQGELAANAAGTGCAFANRCWQAQELCRRETPELREVGPRHYAACHLCTTKV